MASQGRRLDFLAGQWRESDTTDNIINSGRVIAVWHMLNFWGPWESLSGNADFLDLYVYKSGKKWEDTERDRETIFLSV